MATSKMKASDRKQKTIQIVAIVVAGIMIITTVLSALLSQVF